MRAMTEDPKRLRHVLRSAFLSLCAVFAIAACGPAGNDATPTSSADPTHPSHTSNPAAGAEGSAQTQPPTAAGQELDYGVLVDFTVGGGADPLKVSGWSKPETGFTWSQGTTAILAARVKPTDSPITFRFKAAGMIKEPELPFQPVEVFINNDKVADLQVGSTAEFSVPIPPGMTKAGGLLTITFRTPKATSPKALGMTEDERVLGIRVFNIALDRST